MKPIRAGATALGACLVLFTVGCGSKTSQPTTTTSSTGQSSTAPSGQEAANQKAALVRFVNAVPGRSATLAFGDSNVFTDVAYKTVTPYKELPNERHDFKLLTGSNQHAQPAATNSEGLSKGQRYTVVASLDKNGRDKLQVITDNFSEPANGKAKIRLINASADEVDAYTPEAANPNTGTAERMRHPTAMTTANEQKLFSGVNADSSTSFKDVDAQNTNLDIRRSSSRNHRVTPGVRVPVDLAQNRMYTVVVTGGEGRYPLSTMKIEDELTGTPANR